MVRRIAGGGVLALLILASSALGQTTMRWKFKEGEKFYINTVSKQSQTVEPPGGGKQTIDMEITALNSFTVKKVDKDAVIEERIETMDIKGLPGGVDVADQLAGLKGSTFTITLTPEGQVTKVEGLDEMIQKATPKGNPAAAMILRQVLSEETMRKGLAENFAFLPPKPVNKGDTWKREVTIPLGPLGSIKVENSYAYEGKGKDGEEISLKPSITFMAGKGDGQLPFKITKGDFKVTDGKGTIIFNTDTGKMVRQEMNMKMKGSMTIDAAGQELTIGLDIDQKTISKVTDKEPTK